MGMRWVVVAAVVSVAYVLFGLLVAPNYSSGWSGSVVVVLTVLLFGVILGWVLFGAWWFVRSAVSSGVGQRNR